MSWGVCICSKCFHEVHQGRDQYQKVYWYHCELKDRICVGGTAVYAKRKAEIQGKYCLADECGQTLED